jgi:hypothetical protein
MQLFLLERTAIRAIPAGMSTIRITMALGTSTVSAAAPSIAILLQPNRWGRRTNGSTH